MKNYYLKTTRTAQGRVARYYKIVTNQKRQIIGRTFLPERNVS